MLTILFLIFFMLVFGAAYLVLDAVVPAREDMRWNRVGGLTHWRFGRVGGSFYRKASQ